MARSQQTFQKKEKEKQRLKNRQDKQEKMNERKAAAQKGKGLESMMAYLDENGNLSDTPPDPRRMREIAVEDIEIGVPKYVPPTAEELQRKGSVTFFNSSKGFGFITDATSGERIFFHESNLTERLQEGDKVTLEVEHTDRGLSAVNVTKL